MTEPTYTLFTKALESLTNILKDYSLQIDTKKASTVRLLVIRPFAYLYSIVNSYISSFIYNSSVLYLSKSSETQNLVADQVASNYFITRKLGLYALGIVTLVCSLLSVRISKGTVFLIDSIQFITDKTIVAQLVPLLNTDTVLYVQMFKIDLLYRTNIPVVAVLQGYVLIPTGVQCSFNSYVSGISRALLTSPISGGSSGLTDSLMMARCKLRIGSSIGTQQAISLKLKLSSLPFYSCKVTSSNQPGNFRSRYNNLDIATAGIIDTYVKTTNQYMTSSVGIASMSRDSQGFYIRLSQSDYPQFTGALRVLLIKTLDGSELGTYSVSYISNVPYLNDVSARGSIYQDIFIRFLDIDQSKSVVITILYMPNISSYQTFINSDYGSFVGQDILVKAAVPVSLNIQGFIYSKLQVTLLLLLLLKTYIAKYINNMNVGDTAINMSIIALSVKQNFPDIQLRLPYTIGVSMPKINGDIYSFNTSDGTVDIAYRKLLYTWNTDAYFFSTTPDYITLLVL